MILMPVGTIGPWDQRSKIGWRPGRRIILNLIGSNRFSSYILLCNTVHSVAYAVMQCTSPSYAMVIF